MDDPAKAVAAIAVFLISAAVLGWQARRSANSTTDYVVDHNRDVFARAGWWRWPLVVVAVIGVLMLVTDGFSQQSFKAAGGLLVFGVAGGVVLTWFGRRL